MFNPFGHIAIFQSEKISENKKMTNAFKKFWTNDRNVSAKKNRLNVLGSAQLQTSIII